jgi:ribosomal protein S6--L-glutamate ligase
LRLYFLLVRRVPPVPSPVLVEAFDLLRARGYDVEAGIAEEELQRPDLRVPAHDVYVLKSHTELSLSLAGLLHAQSAAVIEPFPSCAATQNKVVAARILRAAGVPVPRTWVLVDPELVLADAAGCERFVVKPHMGHRGARVQVVADAGELRAAAAARADGDMLLAQELIAGPGEDLKVYVVGDDVFAVRKPFSEQSFTVAGHPVAVTPQVREIALRTGRALGLGLYGLDVIESPSGPVVVDVNYFPGYKGVPDAGALIAAYIDGCARRLVADAPSTRPAATSRRRRRTRSRSRAARPRR